MNFFSPSYVLFWTDTIARSFAFGLVVYILSKGPRDGLHQALSGLIFSSLFGDISAELIQGTWPRYTSNILGMRSIGLYFTLIPSTFFVLFSVSFAGTNLEIKLKDYKQRRKSLLWLGFILIPFIVYLYLLWNDKWVVILGYWIRLTDGRAAFQFAPSFSFEYWIMVIYILAAMAYGFSRMIHSYRRAFDRAKRRLVRLMIVGLLFFPVLMFATWLGSGIWLSRTDQLYVPTGQKVERHGTEVFTTMEEPPFLPLAFQSHFIPRILFVAFCVILVTAIRRYWFLRDKELENQDLARLGRYAANIFHEIKNISLLPKIDRLRSLLEAAADLMLEPSAAHRFELIQMTLSDLSRDAQSLRGMSGRYSAALARLDKFQAAESREICINAVLRTLVKELHVELENRKINCFLKEGDESHYIRGDEDLLSIAFRNIMLNAIEAIEAKGEGIGEIRVSMSKKRQLLEVAIVDNGVGMEKTMKDRVLRERFFTTKRGGLGGLGLPIAKSIIEKHDGELHPPQSMVGKGSVFIMEFPIFRSIPYQEG